MCGILLSACIFSYVDGVMVQITAENMDSLRQALREMKDFTISCGKVDAEEPQEHVHIQWVDDDKNFNKGYLNNFLFYLILLNCFTCNAEL